MFVTQQRRETCIHRLHPLVKLLVAGGMTVYALALWHPSSNGVVLVFMIGLLFLARVRPGIRLLVFAALILGVVGIGNYLASSNVSQAATYSMRLMILFAAVPVMAATTAPQDLARSLSRLRIPDAIVVAILLVWRFFPVLAREAREIAQANVLRGSRRGGPVTRVYRGFMVPLAFATFEHSERVSLALELKAFDQAKPRSWYNVPKVRLGDLFFFCSGVAVAALAGWIQSLGTRPW